MTLLFLLFLTIVHFLSYASYISIIDCAADEKCIVPCSSTNKCSNSIINCPANAHCQIQCDDTESCREITVNGPIKHHLSLYCGGTMSCFNATIYAQQAQSLIIEGCDDDESCSYLTIYCPFRHVSGAKNCFIKGNEWQYAHIYARNGWLDIDIDYNDTFNRSSFHFGTIHCTNVSDYDMQCNISQNASGCHKPHDFCNNPTRISSVNNTPSTKTNIDEISLVIILCSICVVIGLFLWCISSRNRAKKPVISDPITIDNNDKHNGESDAGVMNSVVYSSSQDSSALSSTNRQHHSAGHIKHRYNVSAPLQLSLVVQNHINIPSSNHDRSCSAVLHQNHAYDIKELEGNEIKDEAPYDEVEGGVADHIHNDKQTNRGSVVHLDDNIVETDGNNMDEEQKEEVILDAMLSDILEMQNLDPNKIHQINVNNSVNQRQANDDSDSDDSDKIYQR